MTTPGVTEIPLRLAAVERDPFADSLAGGPARDESDTLQGRTGRVRSVLRAGAQSGGATGAARPTPPREGTTPASTPLARGAE